ncbi:pre-mRNA splicing factor domain-containing protein [Ditylenchus destructor]|nr:pre-mRNA splicing factor domain-containing protein [Ditylenchus destructor]
MSGEGSSKEKNLEWMYEGPKSSINREDYLLGKKVDKNFELFSDVVVRDKTEEEKDGLFRKSASRSASSTQKASIIKDKTTVLELTTVRTEDPLVALKVCQIKMSGEGSSKEKNLEWMYEGPKSSINREDYLLGKKGTKDRTFKNIPMSEYLSNEYLSMNRPLREAAAGSSSSMEKRLQTNKKNLQRSHDYMEKSFTRK